ncbi:MAG TPA: hypothetical protein DEP42_04965 [Ruminococcaceae bacterium]|nr:hypothetical protein [Oscillospiraceae bacterium]
MSVRIGNIRLPLDDDDGTAIDLALKTVGLPSSLRDQAYIVKRSPDLRRGQAHFVYTIGLDLSEAQEENIVQKANISSVSRRDITPFRPVPGKDKLDGRPIIIGFGPAGMFAGLLLARFGYRPLIVERGQALHERIQTISHFWENGILNAQTNVQFGEGGAGTFSDGKLTTRIGDPLANWVLQEFVHHGAPTDILRLAKPHIGTDKLRHVVLSIREEIRSLGGEIRFETQLHDLKLQNGKITDILLGTEHFQTGALILAVGHSARDTFSMLQQAGVQLEPKAFSVGVRIEHLQENIDRALYGKYVGHPRLSKGEYQLSLRRGNEAVYTFCMCPGGTVVAAASEQGGVVTNGMSNYLRNGKNANAALVASISAFSSPQEGIRFQKKLEHAAFLAGGSNFYAPCQTVGGFLNGNIKTFSQNISPSYPIGVTPTRLDELFPANITQRLRNGLLAFNKKIHGFSDEDAILTGVETRTSSPVRIPRSQNYEALAAEGLYPAGEGAGYAGGIVSAAVDGLRVASAIVERYRPLEPGC